MKKQICVVIPIYTPRPSEDELFSIKNTISRLPSYDIYFVAPKGLDMAAYIGFAAVHTRMFPARFFRSLYAYNKLMLKIGFYSKFKDYKYMLVVQPDALVIRDDLFLDKLVLEQEYDYWGAPWKSHIKKRLFEWSFYNKWLSCFEKLINFFSPVFINDVGNGGLSLRNIHSVIKLLRSNFFYKTLWGGPEDCFFSCFGQKSKNIFMLADRASASLFAWEATTHENLLLRELPFGVHDWRHYFPEIMNFFPAMQKDYAFFNKIFEYKNEQKLFFDIENFNASPYIKSGFFFSQKDFSLADGKKIEFQFKIDESASGQMIYVNFELGYANYGVNVANVYINNERLCLKIIKDNRFGFSFLAKSSKIIMCLDLLTFPYVAGFPVKSMWMQWGGAVPIGDVNSSFFTDQSSLLQNPYYIYGAGKIAKNVLQSLLNGGFQRPVALLVSNKSDDPDFVLDIPVAQANLVKDKNLFVLVAVSQKFQDEVVSNLKSLGFSSF